LVEFSRRRRRVQVTASETLDFLLWPASRSTTGGGPGAFVMNTREEIIKARDDYLAGRMGGHARRTHLTKVRTFGAAILRQL